MYVTLKRNDIWLPSMLKHEFEIAEITENTIKYYTDCDLVEMIHQYSEFNKPHFDDLSDCLTLEGLITKKELNSLYHLQEVNAILIKEMKHAFLLDQEGFFGEKGWGGFSVGCDEFWASFLLNREMSQAFLNQQVLFFLKDIRIKASMNITR